MITDIVYRIAQLIKNQVLHNSWSKKNDFEPEDSDYNAHHDDFKENYSKDREEKTNSIERDLEIFGIKQFENLSALKSKRNEILKQYHPDRFAHDEKKQALAKEMIQIYNAAYERIVQHYQENKAN